MYIYICKYLYIPTPCVSEDPPFSEIIAVMKYMNTSSCKFWRVLYVNGLFLPKLAAEEAVSAGWAMVATSHEIIDMFSLNPANFLLEGTPYCCELQLDYSQEAYSCLSSLTAQLGLALFRTRPK